MLGVRGSVGLLTDISQRLLQNVSFRCQRVQCLRVGSTEIPNDKPLKIALQHIYGIGRKRSRQILSELGIQSKLAKDLTGIQINSLREEVSKYLLAEDLKRCVDGDIQKLVNMKSYRGYRHVCLLPCRGQRTKTNARTMKEHNRRRSNWAKYQGMAERIEKLQSRQ